MNFSEMKDQAINGVKWYFNRNWNRDDVMNMDEISDELHSTLEMIHSVLILFMGYLVIYSQEILYDANFGDIDFVNCTFTVFFHFPGIMIHATRLYLQGEQQEQN
uniref:Uncharacterized protein n=1 Tax=Solanum tuberosum TaxID=4113 RepID=M1CPK6_SOLTU